MRFLGLQALDQDFGEQTSQTRFGADRSADVWLPNPERTR
jgi:hypothetical protein